MATEIYCPKCKEQMIEGFLLDRNNEVKLQSVWVAGVPENSQWAGLKTKNRDIFNVQAFRCSHCNYLEFYTTEKVDI
jgi:predicted nucleic-acid-binding Zn-ribbon protein